MALRTVGQIINIVRIQNIQTAQMIRDLRELFPENHPEHDALDTLNQILTEYRSQLARLKEAINESYM